MLKSIAFYLLPIVLGYLTVIAVNETERFSSDASIAHVHSTATSPTKCTWACHNNRSHCFGTHLYGFPEGLKKMVRGPVEWMMDELGAKKTGNKLYYQLANLLLLAILWPLLLSIVIMHIAKRYESVHRIRHSMIPIALVGLASLLSVYILQSKSNSKPFKFLYDYLTEFILTLSHWSGLTYYDVNALLFIIIMPLLSVMLIGVLAFRRISALNVLIVASPVTEKNRPRLSLTDPNFRIRFLEE